LRKQKKRIAAMVNAKREPVDIQMIASVLDLLEFEVLVVPGRTEPLGRDELEDGEEISVGANW